jgi:hypothetical protein
MKRDHSRLRYLPWFVRDAVVWPFRMFVLACVVIDLLVWRFATNTHLRGPGPGGASLDIPHGIQAAVWSSGLTIAILMTLGGIVGTDLERGYYRSLFSKPMSPLWYYLQRFLVGAAVILLTSLVLGAGLALGLGSNMGLTWDLIGQIGLSYLLVGSATFLVSRFSSKGWLFVFLASFLQSVVSHVTILPGVPGWLKVLHQALPPFDLLQPALPVPSGGDLWHVVAYGAAMLALALTLLRTRPLGSGITS